MISENAPICGRETLETVFAQYRDQEFLFVEPGGNWGDDLIYRGAERLARKVGITFTRFTFDEFTSRVPTSGVAVYLHGGGTFNPWYRDRGLDALTHALQRYSGPIIQGPQTTANDSEYIKKLTLRIEGYRNPDFYLFARELTTWRNLRQAVTDEDIKLQLDHDTALHLTMKDLLGGGNFKPRYNLLALREDTERPVTDLPFRHFRGLKLDPPRYATSLDHWVRIHAYSYSIITNRTHSAVLSSILGITATLLPGSYHKNRSVWEYSLKSRGIHWRDWPSAQSSDKQMFPQSPLQRIRRSYKLHRLNLVLMPLRGVPHR